MISIISNRTKSLHGRITLIMLGMAIISMLLYVLFVTTIVKRLEDAMITTLVGHEIDEMVSALVVNPREPMPSTLTLKGYMPERDGERGIPRYLLDLAPGIHRHVAHDGRSMMVAIVELTGDRLILEFDTSGFNTYRSLLIIMLIGGGVVAVIVLFASGVWLIRKFLTPVSDLAEELGRIDPDMRSVRIKDKFQDYEVGTIAESIDEYLARLDEFVEREQSFTAAVSHELRTPVSVIMSTAELLELRGLKDDQKEAFERIKTSTVYMGKVIESLLLFAHKTHSALDETLPEIKVKPIFKRIVEQHMAKAHEKGIKLSLSCADDTRARMVEGHLEIILDNLLRNAIANTEAGEVKVEASKHRFSVSDTGKGIEKDMVDKIVKLNYRDENSSGHGVGLYLVSNICNYYGIKLEIDSEPGRGTRFTINYNEYM